MNVLVVVSGLFCTVGAIGSFSMTTGIFLAVFSAIPVVASIDLGPSVPLLSASRVLEAPLLAALACQVAMKRVSVLSFPLSAPLALLVVAQAVSLILSETPSLTGWLHVVSIGVEDVGAYFLAYAVILGEKHARRVLMGFAGVLLLVLGYTCVTIGIGRNPIAEQALTLREGLVFDYSLGERFGLPRFQSFFRNPLDLGMYLMLALPGAVALARGARSVLEALLGWSAVLAGCTSALLSGSRTVIYTLVIALGSYIVIRRRWRLAIALCFSAVLGVTAVGTYFHFPVVDYLLTSALAPSLFAGEIGGSSWHSLLRVTGEHLRMAVERPIFGLGVGTLPPNPASEGLDPYLVGFGEQGYSYLLVEAGIVGLTAMVWLMVRVVRSLWHGVNHGATQFSRRLCMAYLCAVIGYAIGLQLEGIWHFGMMLACVAMATNAAFRPDASAT